MGKKKGKHRHEQGHDHGGGHAHDHGRQHGGFGAVAAIAAMALEQVKSQLDSPAGRQMMATGLRAAADALAPRPARTAEAPPRPAPPAPPEPPVAPEPSAYLGNPVEPPREPAPPPRPEVPPEVARVIGSVAAGLEKWAAKLGTPKG